MTKLWSKLVPTAICLLLVFLFLPFAGNVYVQETYSIGIVRPANGATLDSPVFTLELSFNTGTKYFSGDIDVGYRLVALEGKAPGEGLEGIDTNIGGKAYWPIPKGGKLTDSVDLDAEYHGTIPAGEYEVVAKLRKGSGVMETVATAKSTFYYGTGAGAALNIENFSVAPAKLKAGDPADLAKAGNPVTLTWKVTGASSVSIDHGVGSVTAEGTKDVTPTEASRSSVQYMGEGGTTEVVTYTAMYTLKAMDGFGKAYEKTVTIKIQPKTIDEIFNEYSAWGTNPDAYKWPDGTIDAHPLVGKSSCGGVNNLIEFATWLTGIGSYEGVRWDCNAMQYRSLVCLNELKKAGKLIGWDYMPVEGKAITHTGLYPEHQAVAIWPTGYGDSWRRTATILDPHDRQEPHRYSVTDGLDSIAPWEPDMDFSETYPDLPDSIASKASTTHQYQFDEFDKNTGNRWKNGQGAKTPWQNEKTLGERIQKSARDFLAEKAEQVGKPVEEVLDTPLKDVFKMAGVFCPANVLITNSAGQRLGMLSDGTLVAEFEPFYADYWSDENGEKQWVFALIDDTYKIDITGSKSEDFRLLTYTGGDNINDYGENPLTIGKAAVLTMQAGTVGQLTLADGTKVTPTAKAIDSFLPAPTTAPTTGPTTDAIPTSAQTPTSDSEWFNWGLIAVIIAAVILIVSIVFLVRKKA
jgi:hypothetical protein